MNHCNASFLGPGLSGLRHEDDSELCGAQMELDLTDEGGALNTGNHRTGDLETVQSWHDIESNVGNGGGNALAGAEGSHSALASSNSDVPIHASTEQHAVQGSVVGSATSSSLLAPSHHMLFLVDHDDPANSK
jgi:hypothetical protein